MAAAALRDQLNALLSSMFSTGLVDEQFQQLQMLQDDGGTPGFVAEVVTLFCDDADRIIAELASLLEQPAVDFDKVDACVHQLKGSSASVGAQKVKLTCMQFRQFCEEKSREGCLMALAVVRNEFYDLRNKFQTMLQYPINLSGAHMSQAFYSSDYAPCYESPSIPTSSRRNKRHTVGSAADIPCTPSDGQGDDNEEEEEDDVEEEEIRS